MFIFMGLTAGFFRNYLSYLARKKDIEAKLWKSENKYRKIVETSLEGIVITSPDGEIYFANRKFAELLGYSTEEIIGRSANEFITEDYLYPVKSAREKLEAGHNVQEMMRFARKCRSGGLCECNDLYQPEPASGAGLGESELRHRVPPCVYIHRLGSGRKCGHPRHANHPGLGLLVALPPILQRK
jgi:PAS domain S-box-containing protein